MFSEKLNDFYNEITKDFFAVLDNSCIMTNQYLLPGLINTAYHDNFYNRDSFKMAQQLTRTVGVINLSQFLHATLTILS